MSDLGRYFAQDDPPQDGEGTWIDWQASVPLDLLPGLRFQPVAGERVMANFVHFEPHTEAPLHWHAEEQITFVVDGELEFEVAGEKRVLRRGQAVVIPPNTPHAARSLECTCFEVDVFHPPRQGILDLMRRP